MSHAQRPSPRPPSAVATTENYRETLAHAELLLAGFADGVTVQDARGALLYVNDAAARMCGFPDAATMRGMTAAEIIGHLEVFDEHGHPLALEDLPGRRLLAGETPEPILMKVRHRNGGRTFWTLVRAHAVGGADGTPKLALNVWYDATMEQRQRAATRCLADATARLASSIDYAETLKAVAQALVPELADWCGVDLVEDGVSRSLAVAHADAAKAAMAIELRRKYPADAGASNGVPAVLRTGRAELYRELSPALLAASARDAEHHDALVALDLRSVMIVPILVNGKAEGALTLASAESGRLFDEEDLALACEIGRRAGTAIENARAYRSAQRAVRARDEFLAVAGHELRTPLAALMLQIESIKQALEAGKVALDPARFAGRLDKTFGHALRLARLVDGLLDVSRVSETRIELALEDIDVAALVRDTCERFTDDAARAHCPLNVVASETCPGRFDPHRLEQVVSNLLSNAMKYGDNKPIAVRCTCREDAVVIEVEDAGIGIAVEDVERVFERFERAVSERNYPGLGLGLWITRELVSAHGGSIDLKSQQGRGSTFTVTLPRTPS